MIGGEPRLSSDIFVLPLDKWIKKRAVISVARRKEVVVDETLMYDLIGAAIENKKSDETVLDCLKRVDLTRIMKDSPGLNKQFTCSFFVERKAWIFKTKKGFYRYYTRKKASVFSFDLVDLLGIFRNETRKEVLAFIQHHWHLRGLTDWYIEQMEKYESNDWVLYKIQQSPEQYPHLNQLVKKHWPVLERLNEFAKQKMVGKELSADNKAVFFLSNNYFMEQYFPKYSISTINNLVNLFCVLGFMKKVPFQEIPKELSDEAVKQYKLKKVGNHTSYYWILDFRNVCEEAERRAKILADADIYYHRLSKQVVKNLFGESFTNDIYVQKTFGKRAKSEPVYIKGQDTLYTESEKLEKLFLRELKDTGKCAKYALAKSSLLPRRRFDNFWKTLIKKHQCEEKYPTKSEMEQFQMEKRLLIAVPVQERYVS